MLGQSSGLTETKARVAYELLVRHVGATDDEDSRQAFVRYVTEDSRHPYEWRFCGTLGFGGKFRLDSYHGAYVDCYPDDLTPERQIAIGKVNIGLQAVVRPSAELQAIIDSLPEDMFS